jgi:NTP pyrophosphatase (non-canonical NTP hydrolase)
VVDLLQFVRRETLRAQERFGNPASTHEALGVITEEYFELVHAIRTNRLDRIREEALQVSAAALRLAEACDNTVFLCRSVK